MDVKALDPWLSNLAISQTCRKQEPARSFLVETLFMIPHLTLALIGQEMCLYDTE